MVPPFFFFCGRFAFGNGSFKRGKIKMKFYCQSGKALGWTWDVIWRSKQNISTQPPPSLAPQLLPAATSQTTSQHSFFLLQIHQVYRNLRVHAFESGLPYFSIKDEKRCSIFISPATEVILWVWGLIHSLVTCRFTVLNWFLSNCQMQKYSATPWRTSRKRYSRQPFSRREKRNSS